MLSTTSSRKDEKENIILGRILKCVKINVRRQEEEKLKLKQTEELIIEWKEVSRKLENVFFFITLITIIIAPVILFGKLFLRDITKIEVKNSSCACDYSFIKNI